MSRLIIPVNFDNDKTLYDYVNSKGNKAEFIRNCISKAMYEERLMVGEDKDLEAKIERIMRKCLQEYNPTFDCRNEIKEASNELQVAASFFDED